MTNLINPAITNQLETEIANLQALLDALWMAATYDEREEIANRMQVAINTPSHGIQAVAQALADRFEQLTPPDYTLLVLRRKALSISLDTYGFRPVGAGIQFTPLSLKDDPATRYLRKHAFFLHPGWKAAIDPIKSARVVLRIEAEGSQEGFTMLNFTQNPEDVALWTLPDLHAEFGRDAALASNNEALLHHLRQIDRLKPRGTLTQTIEQIEQIRRIHGGMCIALSSPRFTQNARHSSAT